MVLLAGCTPASTPPPPSGNRTAPTPSGTAAAQGGRMVLLTNGNSPFWDACRFGLQQGAKDFQLADDGLAALMEVNDGSPQGQIDKLRQFASQTDIVAVAVSALDADNVAVADEMRKLRARGVHVICVDADVNRQSLRDARSYYIGTDNLTGGRVLGTAARGLLAERGIDQGGYVQFVGRTGSHNARERMDGFKEAVGERFQEADRMGDDLDRTRARDNVRNALRNHPDLVALVGIWSYNAPAIVDVVTQEQKRDQFTIVTFDAEPIAIKQMAQGSIDAMVVQNPYEMGYQAVRLMKALIQQDEAVEREMFPRADQADGDLYDTGLKVVVAGSDAPLKRDHFAAYGDRVQFLTLDEFQAWLDEYSLKGS